MGAQTQKKKKFRYKETSRLVKFQSFCEPETLTLSSGNGESQHAHQVSPVTIDSNAVKMSTEV